MNGHSDFRLFTLKNLDNVFLFHNSLILSDLAMKQNMYSIIKIFIILIIAVFLLLVILRIFLYISASRITYQIEDIPKIRTAIILGAGLRNDGSPTPILKDRVRTGVALYKSGKVEKLLLSGDNRFVTYNEPAAMASYARDLGVPQSDLILDYAGQSTYASCYRARAIFKLDQAILVTQSFHLPRALFICNQLGVDSIGVSASSDQQHYSVLSFLFLQLRELPASFVALLDVWIIRPIPILGNPEPIYKEKS
jgi:SanA protein